MKPRLLPTLVGLVAMLLLGPPVVLLAQTADTPAVPPLFTATQLIMGLLVVIQVLLGLRQREADRERTLERERGTKLENKVHELERDVSSLEVHVGTGAGTGTIYSAVDRVRSDVELLRNEFREDMQQLRDQISRAMENPGTIRHRRIGGTEP